MMSIENTEKVMNAVHQHFDVDLKEMEVSTETTPRIAASEYEKIKAYPLLRFLISFSLPFHLLLSSLLLLRIFFLIDRKVL